MKKKIFLFLILTMCITSSALAYEAFNAPMGLLKHDKSKTYDGYLLFTPSLTNTAYLVDMDANIVHTWTRETSLGYAQLLPNGNIIVARREADTAPPPTQFGGETSVIEELDWAGNLVWSYRLYTQTALLLSSFERMPNGNTLLSVIHNVSYDEAIKAGKDPKVLQKEYEYVGDPNKKITGMWPGKIIEVNPKGEIVWSWDSWDHKGTGPDQLDINFHAPASFNTNFAGPDWTHFNCIRYVADRDMIILNSRNFSEFFFIDHKTGKITFRFGNPGTHGKGKLPSAYGDNGDQILFGPHDVNMLPNGNITLFDNGTARPSGPYSRAIELDPTTGKIVWQYFPNNPGFAPNSFYSPYQSSVQKLPNGNYFVLSSNNGHMFEVTKDKEVVWDFVNPINPEGKFCSVDGGSTFTFMMHKSFRYAKDFEGFKGKDMTPKGKLVEGCPDWTEVLQVKPFVTR